MLLRSVFKPLTLRQAQGEDSWFDKLTLSEKNVIYITSWQQG